MSLSHRISPLGRSGFRSRPELIVLPVRPGSTPSSKPPVRIFLGTETSQFRATRVFVWSIEQVRDPGRVYEIHVMSELAGFDRRGWTTGFTNYRFSIPHFCEGRGRAIFNDEDEIYLADPAELFDLELGDYGVLAISDTESSVMLIDCERMAKLWSLEDAQNATKKALLARARAATGVRGSLDPSWNSRDEEYEFGRSKLLHYTTLHTQPWRPFPERFVYQESPQAKLWHDLEESATRSGFEVFHRGRPSDRLSAHLRAKVEACDISERPERARDDPEVAALADLAARSSAGSLLELVPGCGGEAELTALSLPRARRIGLATALDASVPLEIYDGVACLRGLEEVPPDDMPWVVDEMFRRARSFVFASVGCSTRLPKAPRGMPPLGSVYTPEWWTTHFETAARRHPQVHWELAIQREGETELEFRLGGRFLGDSPTVWVLTDERPGNTTQSLGLAEALGWPHERVELRFNAWSYLPNPMMGASSAVVARESAARLVPPWPDLVIAAGRRTAPVARWIAGQSRGRTRTVQLGRKGANPAGPFDLCVTPSYACLLPHPRRLETALPITRVRRENLERAAERWRSLFEGAARPRIAVLVGGASQRHVFAVEDAVRLGREAAALAEQSGGSLFVTTSRRTPHAAVEALERVLPAGSTLHRFTPGERPEDNPYLGLLAHADALLVTGESESMLAEACATGVGVFIHPMQDRRRGPLLWLADRVIEAVASRATEKPLNNRGTPRPQQGLELWCARLIAGGWIRPNRDLGQLHATLVAAGVARMSADGFAELQGAGANAIAPVVARVRALMGV